MLRHQEVVDLTYLDSAHEEPRLASLGLRQEFPH